MSKVGPVYLQLRTFRWRCPLSCELGLLHPQEQTFLVVPPFVWFDPKPTYALIGDPFFRVAGKPAIDFPDAALNQVPLT